jgi:hypothetical protein
LKGFMQPLKLNSRSNSVNPPMAEPFQGNQDEIGIYSMVADKSIEGGDIKLEGAEGEDDIVFITEKEEIPVQ